MNCSGEEGVQVWGLSWRWRAFCCRIHVGAWRICEEEDEEEEEEEEEEEASVSLWGVLVWVLLENSAVSSDLWRSECFLSGFGRKCGSSEVWIGRMISSNATIERQPRALGQQQQLWTDEALIAQMNVLYSILQSSHVDLKYLSHQCLLLSKWVFPNSSWCVGIAGKLVGDLCSFLSCRAFVSEKNLFRLLCLVSRFCL